MNLKFSLTHFIAFFLGFCLFTVVGTITHEYGHIVVAQSLGYDTQLNHASMDYHHEHLYQRYHDLYELNKHEIENDIPFKGEPIYRDIQETIKRNDLLILLGGPLQTILTGLIGFLYLIYRKPYARTKLRFIEYLAVFLSLFWLRQLFNLLNSVGSEILMPDGSYFSGDEAKIAQGFNIWEGTVVIGLGVIAFAICSFVIFRIIPKRLRLTFILAGLSGSLIAFYLWMNFIGPQLFS